MSLKNTLLLFHILFIISTLPAQSPDHVWLDNGTIRVRINADGRLFCDDEKGAFLVPHGDSMVSIMRGAGLWFGGFDPSGNLFVSTQLPSPGRTDYIPGFYGVPNSGKVWKVTDNEKMAHVADFKDNLQIDQPIPSIFSWPAQGNTYFNEYNNFELPEIHKKAGFESIVNAGDFLSYEPQLGEIPFLKVDYLDIEWRHPDQFAFFAFHTDPELAKSPHWKFPVQVYALAFMYDCPENDILSRSVFVHYNWQMLPQTEIRLDSVSVGILLDPDIGDRYNDYHGYISNSTYFAYNASTSDSIFAEHAPVFIANVFQPPVETILRATPNGYFFDYQSSFFDLMPINCANENGACNTVPYGMRMPEVKGEFFNTLTGTWRDGIPLTAGGTGYNPGNPDAEMVNGAFQGYPHDPGVWSEINAQNTPGNRAALLHFDLGYVHPTDYNAMTVMYTFQPKTSTEVTMELKQWHHHYEYLFEHIFCCIDNWANPYSKIGCETDARTYSSVNNHLPDTLTVFPNPASEVLKVWHNGLELQKMLLFDTMGRVAGTGVNHNTHSEIPVEHLPAGLYWLVVETRTGDRKVQKVVVAR